MIGIIWWEVELNGRLSFPIGIHARDMVFSSPGYRNLDEECLKIVFESTSDTHFPRLEYMPLNASLKRKAIDYIHPHSYPPEIR